jgi:glycosyltransferase involved in cell wall biosynthesis
MKMPRIFIDAHILDDHYQGSKTHLLGLYKELIKSHQDIHFYFAACSIENLKSEFGEGDNIHFVKYRSGNKYFRLAFDIPLIIKKYNIDVAHFQYILPLFKSAREILTIHDVLFLDFPELFPPGYRIRNRILFSISAKRADTVLTVSGYSRDKIARHFNTGKENISVIPNAVSEIFFTSDGISTDVRQKYELDKYILSVGRVEPRKNHLTLLRAFDELDLYTKGYKLVFVGTPSIRVPELNDYLYKLTSDRRGSILFLEDISRDELRSFYRNCSLFVFPSLAEGFGIPPLEAVASGVPVLCSDATAMSDFSFMKWRLFDPCSVGELKEKIIRSLNYSDPDRGQIIETVREKYSWKKSADIFSGVLRQLLIK